jgi:hypothetical protein
MFTFYSSSWEFIWNNSINVRRSLYVIWEYLLAGGLYIWRFMCDGEIAIGNYYISIYLWGIIKIF